LIGAIFRILAGSAYTLLVFRETLLQLAKMANFSKMAAQ